MHFTIYYFVALFFLPVFGAPYPKPAYISEVVDQGHIVATLPIHNGIEATRPHPAILDGPHPDGGYSVFPISTHPPPGRTNMDIEKFKLHPEIKGYVGLETSRVDHISGRYINHKDRSEDPKARSRYYSPMHPDRLNELKGYAELHKNGQTIPTSPPVSPVSENGPTLGHPNPAPPKKILSYSDALKSKSHSQASTSNQPQTPSPPNPAPPAGRKILHSDALKSKSDSQASTSNQPQTPSPPNPAPPASKKILSFSDALKSKSASSTSNQPQTPSPPNPAPPAAKPKISYSDALKNPKSNPSTSNLPQTPSPAPPAAKPKISYSDALKQNSKS